MLKCPNQRNTRKTARVIGRGGDSDNDSDGYDSDWDTSAWSPDEIHSSLELLIDTAQSAHQKKKRRVAIAMMVRLLKKHKSARERMDVLLFGLVELGLSMRKGKARTQRQIRIGKMISSLVTVMPQKLSRLGCVSKCTRLLTKRVQHAALMLQHAYRAARFERLFAKLQLFM